MPLVMWMEGRDEMMKEEERDEQEQHLDKINRLA